MCQSQMDLLKVKPQSPPFIFKKYKQTQDLSPCLQILKIFLQKATPQNHLSQLTSTLKLTTPFPPLFRPLYHIKPLSRLLPDNSVHSITTPNPLLGLDIGLFPIITQHSTKNSDHRAQMVLCGCLTGQKGTQLRMGVSTSHYFKTYYHPAHSVTLISPDSATLGCNCFL